MALLGHEYESSDEGGSPITTSGGNPTAANPVVAAPEVSLDVWSYNFRSKELGLMSCRIQCVSR